MGVEIHGRCEPLFQPLADAFAANFEDGLEFGASLGLMHGGRLVVDLWAGHTDAGRTYPWQRDTIEVVFSLTKVATMLAFLRLVDKGSVELDAPVARYWPAFAAGGKAGVTIRDALSHRAGVPGFNPPIDFATCLDWDAAAANLADQPHWYGGERKAAYHANTYGNVLGEIIRRVDGRRTSQFFREEIGAPAGIDFQIGVPLGDQGRIADLVVTAPPELSDIGEENLRIMTSLGDGDWSAPETRVADMPSNNGYTNGRALAQLFSIGAQLGVYDGVRYISEELMREALRPQATADKFMFQPAVVGFGLGLAGPSFPSPTPTSAHWGGYGGSQGLMDPATGIAYGHVMNHLIVSGAMDSEPRWTRLWNALTDLMRRL